MQKRDGSYTKTIEETSSEMLNSLIKTDDRSEDTPVQKELRDKFENNEEHCEPKDTEINLEQIIEIAKSIKTKKLQTLTDLVALYGNI